MHEIELKLSVDKTTLAELTTAPPPRGFQASAPATQQLRSIYYDTCENTLQKAGYSLRTRSKNDKWLQTIKQGGTMQSGLARRVELETPINGTQPDFDAITDKDLRNTIESLSSGKQLIQLFETVITRNIIIYSDNTGARIEAAMDSGHAKTQSKEHPIYEVELELLEGPVQSLYKLAQELLKGRPLLFSNTNKAGIGYRLASGEPPELVSAPRNASEVQFKPEDTAAFAFQSILRECLDQITANRSCVLQQDVPEGPHQLRVGLRRLRSLFNIYKKAFSTNETIAGLDQTAKELASVAGNLRDIDVLIEDIIEPVIPLLPETHSVVPLLEAIKLAQVEARVELRRALVDPKLNDFLLKLGEISEAPDYYKIIGPVKEPILEQSVAQFSQKALRKRWHACQKRAEGLEHLTIEQRHDLRKTLKKMRYTMEFFRSLNAPEDIKVFLKCLKRLQNTFGYLNDVAMAERLVAMKLPDTDQNNEVSTVIGYIAGWHQARADHAWLEAQDRWAAADEAPKYW